MELSTFVKKLEFVSSFQKVLSNSEALVILAGFTFLVMSEKSTIRVPK